MAFVIADRVRETTSTTGTGTITLAGPYTGFQAFSVIGNGNTTYYAIIDAATGAWEVGIGTYTTSGNTLSRTTVLASSNADALVNFSAGVKDVICTQPAERTVLVQTGGTGLVAGAAAFTANGVPYADSTSTLTTGSALTFNGVGVGINTTASNIQLATTVNTNQAYISLADADGRTAVFRGPNSGAPNCAQIGTTTNHDTAFLYGNTEAMRLTSTGLDVKGKLGVGYSDFSGLPANGAAFAGSVGIGTSSPNGRLQVTDTNRIFDSVGNLNVFTSNTAATDIGGSIAFGGNNSTGGISPYVFAKIQGIKEGTANSWNGALLFGTTAGSSAITERMRLNSAGNLGLGATPSAWVGNTAFQLANNPSSAINGALYQGAVGGNNVTGLTHNAYFDGSVWKTIYTAATYYASRYEQTSGNHAWYNAGLTNGTISFNQAMTLTASSELVIDSGTGGGRLTFQPGNTANSILSTTTGFGAYNILRYYGTQHQWFNPSSQAMTLTAGGLLAVGTTAPNAILTTAPRQGALPTTNSVLNGLSLFNDQENVTGDGVQIFFDHSYRTPGTQSRGAYIRSTSVANYATAVNLQFGTSSSDTLSTKMTLDSAGNLGLGVVPNTAWNFRAFQIDSQSALWSSGVGTFLSTNNFNDGFNKYITTGNATRYYQLNGQHVWETAPSWNGSGSNLISFNQAMTLDANARLGVGVGMSSPSARIHAYGSGEDQSEVRVQNVATSQNSRANLRLVSATSTYGGGLMQTNATDTAYPTSSLCLYTFDNQPLIFGTNNTERARITAGGDLLVGTTTAAYGPSGGRGLIEINGSTNSLLALKRSDTNNFYLQNASDAVYMQNTANTPVIIGTNNQGRVRIETNGDMNVFGGIAPRTRLYNGGPVNTAFSNNWFKIGTIYLSDSFAATIRVQGTSGYGSGGGISGETAIHLRGDNTVSGIGATGYFYGTTQGDGIVGQVAIRLVSGRDYEVFVRSTGFFANMTAFCDSTSTFIPESTDTGSTSTPSGAVELETRWSFATAGYERARIDQNGNLLVGTTGTIYASSGRGIIELNGSSESLISLKRGNANPFYIQNTSSGIFAVNTANTNLIIGTNNTERVRVAAAGEFMVGKTAISDVAEAGFLCYANANKGIVTATTDLPNANTYHVYNLNATNNGYRFYVNVNGGIYNYSGNNVNISDERTKKNIEVAGSYLDKICAIPVKLFNYKDEAEGEQRTLGVIAQDVEAVAPEFVNNEGWKGTTPEDGVPIKTIYTTDMMFGLMRALQELKAEFDAYKATHP